MCISSRLLLQFGSGDCKCRLVTNTIAICIDLTWQPKGAVNSTAEHSLTSVRAITTRQATRSRPYLIIVMIWPNLAISCSNRCTNDRSLPHDRMSEPSYLFLHLKANSSCACTTIASAACSATRCRCFRSRIEHSSGGGCSSSCLPR